ncbi:MAG: L-aspartate oxidase [Fimbriimonadales bacterium]|nr:L-aspartate oxidase [Fimbriimonadales bacterium]
MAPVEFDFLVLGSGLAGLSFALEAARHGTVGVLTKAQAEESNTGYAQGGIAAAVGEADSWELHERDTLVAGAGLNDVRAVRFLVRQAPAAIEWLRSLGARFDVRPEDNSLRLGREGGHSRSRIVHHADNTGWEIERAVVEAVRSKPNITVYEHTFATELLVADGRCVGAAGMVSGIGLRVFLGRRAVLLATGGCGKIYSHTTNPRVATGDGYALALRVGAELRNMEFMQFHPTTLYHPQMRSFLISEAVRGAGATLRNHHGRRFMYDYDERLELAPRDVVARAIDAEMKRLQTWCVYLDTTHLKKELLEERFPTIYNALKKVDIEIHKDWIPVVPAQHYSCGGVVTDLDGRTNVPGLYAAGEVACTGVHGGNRLASNSLLEALVFGRAAANAAAHDEPYRGPAPEPSPVRCVPEAQAVRIRHGVQRIMTDHVGIVRTNAGLAQALERIEALRADYGRQPAAEFSVYAAETPNILDTALEVVRSAIARKENVGLHYNLDLVSGGER